jgi:hypothetical protein
MRRSSLLSLVLALAVLAVCVGIALNRAGRAEKVGTAAMPEEKKRSEISADAADDLLRDEPLTIVFRRIREHTLGPWRWCWSINSAGDGELIISSMKPDVQRKMAVSRDQLATIRQSLRAERFVALKDSYGPLYIHGGWDTLTVIAGENINKSVRYNSVWSWAKEADTLTRAAQAARVWLTVVEILDPDGTVFGERKELASAVEALKE